MISAVISWPVQYVVVLKIRQIDFGVHSFRLLNYQMDYIILQIRSFKIQCHGLDERILTGNPDYAVHVNDQNCSVATTDIHQRYQTSYTAPCNRVVSHGAQFGGLRVFADHKRKTNALTILTCRAVFNA